MGIVKTGAEFTGIVPNGASGNLSLESLERLGICLLEDVGNLSPGLRCFPACSMHSVGPSEAESDILHWKYTSAASDESQAKINPGSIRFKCNGGPPCSKKFKESAWNRRWDCCPVAQDLVRPSWGLALGKALGMVQATLAG